MSCCPKARAWDIHARALSAKLTAMIPRVTALEQLNSEKLSDLRDFARKLLNDKLLHTNEWTFEKLVDLEQRVTTKIEVFSIEENFLKF